MYFFLKLLPLFMIFFREYVSTPDNRFGVIVNGKIAKISNYPYYAFLAHKNRELLCGGAIIKTNVILTAAHCLSSKDFYVFTGIETTSELSKSHPYPVKQVIKYPVYRGETSFDIGLVILRERIKLGPKVKIINVANVSPRIGSEVSVVGFGDTGCKQKVSKPIVGFICKGIDSNSLRSAVLKVFKHQRRVLYTTGARQNTCYGDSGGPVVYRNKIVGLVSSGQYNNCSGYDTQVAVAPYYYWIKRYLVYY